MERKTEQKRLKLKMEHTIDTVNDMCIYLKMIWFD